MKKCAPCRIVNVSSNAYTMGKIDFEDLAMKNYDIYKAYARSKLAQIQFTIEAHRRWSPDVVLSYAVHPGKSLYLFFVIPKLCFLRNIFFQKYIEHT